MTLFTVENREFGWDEVVVGAQVRGEWQPFVETVRQSQACLRYAAKTSQLPPDVETREAVNAFRYAHNLISADDARSWLARWGMTIEEWMNYFRSQSLRDRWARRLGEIVTANPVSDAEVAAVIRSHAVCAGRLDEWAVGLAGRAAIAARSVRLDAGEPSAARSVRDLISRIEAEFQQQRLETLTPKLIESKIADHRLDWIRFDCRYVWFGEERIAREAAFCVTEDGLTLDEVAWDARSIVQQWNFYLDEIEASTRPHFLAARQGDWLGPIKLLEGFPLFSILSKLLPAADDPQIRERAERSIIASFTEQAINERVRWAIP
ncbi:MAG TPA: hypothetical protein VLD57_10755, partial [Blastocatellia bacterium]|nr:hypothetical protein [Blastocatellia bacterium]